MTATGTSWGSLYLPFVESEAISTALRELLPQAGYELYDPFGLLPGKAYTRTVRLFVAPAQGGWVRVIGLADAELCAALSRLALCLALELDGAEAVIAAYADGAQADPESALLPHLRPGLGAADLERALNNPTIGLLEQETPGGVFGHLPEDVRVMSDQVDMGKAQSMFERLSGGLVGKVGQRTGTDADTMSEAARGLLGGNAPDWNSTGGRRIRALMACLTVPENWREPDFITLRDAYPLHKRLQRNPNARQYPGDAETLARVPDALAYTPIYGGQ